MLRLLKTEHVIAVADPTRRDIGGGGLFDHTDGCANCSPDRCSNNCAGCGQIKRRFKHRAFPRRNLRRKKPPSATQARLSLTCVHKKSGMNITFPVRR